MMISESHWLAPWEQLYVCKKLMEYNLAKWDNKRSLPLRSGGKTDVYVNLRNARNIQEALGFLADLYQNPLLRLKPDRFVEVPDSVSCFAGILSIKARLPYITIREEAKEGRVSKAKVIGDPKWGDRVCIIDDVITTGESASIPYRECIRLGLEIMPMVVLVDRQEGWEKRFTEESITMDIWSGMTLHTLRKYLINNGVMERCNKDLEEKNPLIIALDGKEWKEILPLIDQLRTSGCILKVNDLLLDEGMKNLIPDLEVYGRVMADIKAHDIPNTVQNIVRRLLKNPPWAVTVHGSGGEEMVKTVVEMFKGTNTRVLVVTVLTTIDAQTSEEIYSRMPANEVRVLAEIAKRAGAHGLVCSPEEVKDLREIYPKMILVTPGIRSPEVGKDDQKRTGTPKQALEDGSNYLVMGRQITNARDPILEVNRLLTEELKIF